MLIQLPDDCVSVAYCEVRPFHFEQVFHSPRSNFTGTEREFVAQGLAYAYVQTGPHTRVVLPLEP